MVNLVFRRGRFPTSTGDDVILLRKYMAAHRTRPCSIVWMYVEMAVQVLKMRLSTMGSEAKLNSQ